MIATGNGTANIMLCYVILYYAVSCHVTVIERIIFFDLNADSVF